MTFNSSMTPKLNTLIENGNAFYDEESNEFVGTNLEGKEIVLGITPEMVEKFLVNYPEPSNW
jgi:hypothetical protein